MEHVVPKNASPQLSPRFWERTDELQQLIMFSIGRASNIWEDQVEITVSPIRKFWNGRYRKCLEVLVEHPKGMDGNDKLQGYIDYQVVAFIQRFPEPFLVFNRCLWTEPKAANQ